MVCENCGCNHNGEYGSGRFCSSKCARSYSSNVNNEIRKKNIQESVDKFYMKSGISRKLVKKCSVCGATLSSRRKSDICRDCESRSKKCIAEYPYENYYIYITYHKKENRRYACLIRIDNGERMTISYARYLMSIKLRRFLYDSEEVDHIDGDSMHDSIDNLQLLSKSEHHIKTSKSKRFLYGKIVCPVCKKVFIRLASKMKSIKNDTSLEFCSKSCASKFRRSDHSDMQKLRVHNIISISEMSCYEAHNL